MNSIRMASRMRSRLQLAVLVVLDMLLLWVATSLLRGKGLLPFAAGLLALGVALVQLRRGRPRALLAVSFVLLLSGAGVLALEATLRLFPGLLRGRVANYTFTGYHGERDGIYRADERLGVSMRPRFRRSMYWNGHWWTHESNESGYRGPQLTSADAVFLGDSMIYGHGVEASDTVPARFEAVTRRKAANLGQQGTCLVQALLLLREKGLSLRPRWVFVSSHPNDPKDALSWYEGEELKRFLREDGYLPWARAEYREEHADSVFDLWMRNAVLPLRGARALHAALKRTHDDKVGINIPPPPAGPFVPSPAALDEPFAPESGSDELRLGWAVHRHALARIKKECDSIGARMVVFDLGYPRAYSRAVEEAARAIGAAYDPAGQKVLARAVAGDEMYLPGDGHWTRAAADEIARSLAAAVTRGQ